MFLLIATAATALVGLVVLLVIRRVAGARASAPLFRLFRWVALAEGVTAIALFFVAMPAKYAFDYDALIPAVGMGHGVAWLIYIAAMVMAFAGQRIGAVGWLRTFAASLIPLGTFFNDRYVHRLERAAAAS